MAIANNELGKPATWRIDGKTILMKSTKVTPEGTPWEAVTASRVIAGFKAGERTPWMVKGTPVLDGKFTVAELLAVSNSTIGVDMGNGDVYALRGCKCATLPEHDSDEGLAGELTFIAKSGELL